MMFAFVVRHLRWLARAPILPHIFDALLLAWTAVFCRARFAAITELESRTFQIPGIDPSRHRFGGIGFNWAGREFAHLHGNGLLDVQLTRATAERLIARGLALPHHVFGPSAWVSFWIRSRADLPKAENLIALGMSPPADVNNAIV